VLVVAGAEDAMLDPDEAKRATRRLARGTACQIAGAGHLVPCERGAALATEIDHWLAKEDLT
jgi:pimeloyl-ACP methyl ester carboxylesterase